MKRTLQFCSAIGITLISLLKSQVPGLAIAPPALTVKPTHPTCQGAAQPPNFLVLAGGGAPKYNEIALEKNVLYFQRTLQLFGFDPGAASIFFANGNDGKATVRYIDPQRQERYKAPEIPNLDGPATVGNFQRWLQQMNSQGNSRPVFFYFTGHGYQNTRNLEDNAMILWGEDLVGVKQFATSLDRIPAKTPVVAMMAQCYSGSFANFIYQGGDPRRPVALQTRCGFFATVKEYPSIGCTPEVNEADYRDYSSSFFAGLSGRSRIGQPVASADYNRDGRVGYNEAHAFAKVDEQGIDLPLSTSEAWLRRRVNDKAEQTILSQPIDRLLSSARPEQQYVVNTLSKRFAFNPRESFVQNYNRMDESRISEDFEQAYLARLYFELLNIGAEQQLRATKNQKQIAVLDRLLRCESGSWNSSP